MAHSIALVIPLAFILIGCGSVTDAPAADAGVGASFDADSNAPDADPSAPDADPNAPDSRPPDTSMSFFVTSSGNGAAGGDYDGLIGADARCQDLAAAAGAGGRTWAAYLSTVVIGNFGELVHARDRIGAGPWYNFDGDLVATDVDDLHTNTFPVWLILDEQGDPVPSEEHDILTGSLPDGTARTEFPNNPSAPGPTCDNWTTNDPGAYAWVGHSDSDSDDSWGSAHETQCDEKGMSWTLSTGRLYCFAVD